MSGMARRARSARASEPGVRLARGRKPCDLIAEIRKRTSPRTTSTPEVPETSAPLRFAAENVSGRSAEAAAHGGVPHAAREGGATFPHQQVVHCCSTRRQVSRARPGCLRERALDHLRRLGCCAEGYALFTHVNRACRKANRLLLSSGAAATSLSTRPMYSKRARLLASCSPQSV